MGEPVDTTIWRMDKCLAEWGEFKLMRVKSINVRSYLQVVRRGLMAILRARDAGKTRADGGMLQWRPKLIGPDEAQVILSEYENREAYIFFMNNFLIFNGNPIFKRTVYKLNKGIPQRKTWFTFAENSLIRQVASRCSPNCHLFSHVLNLGTRPIGIMRMTMTSPQYQSRCFILRDKGRDPRDKEQGKLCRYGWDRDTAQVLDRYLHWREERFLEYEEKHGLILPRPERVLVHGEIGKPGAFGQSPYTGAKSSHKLLRELRQAPELAHLAPFITPYNIRRSHVAHLCVLKHVQNENRMTDSGIMRLMNWDTRTMIDRYEGEIAKLMETVKLKEQELMLLESFPKEIEEYDEILSKERVLT